jgi:hypothetical protein
MEVWALVEFGPAATEFVRRWLKNYGLFQLNVTRSEWSEMFAVMVGLGFFTYTNDRYQMTIPSVVDAEQIADVLLRLAATEDGEYYLHPENLVEVRCRDGVTATMQRIGSMKLPERIAERQGLLDVIAAR